MRSRSLAGKFTVLAGLMISCAVFAGEGEFTLIHSGDIHGHLVPRPNVRSDTTGHMEGGLARMATVINQIRAANPDKTIYINTGDTLQGSAEAMFTRGQALVDVMNLLKPDFDEPGNWDYLYGTERFLETFVGSPGKPPLFDTQAVAANLYFVCPGVSEPFCPGKVSGKAGESDRPALGVDRKTIGAPGYVDLPPTDATSPYPEQAGRRPLPPYLVKTVNGVKVGILGMTTARAIRAVGPFVTKGFVYTDGENEMPYYINKLRNIEHVDVVVMISELELSRTIDLASRYPGVDFVLNADMHERTIQPIILKTGTLLVEEGQDGTMLGEISIKVKEGHKNPVDSKLAWEWTPHIITDAIEEDAVVARKVAEVRSSFVSGTFAAGQTVTIGGNTSTLLRPVDTVVGYTAVPLHRSNFSNSKTDSPAVIEGTSHDLIVDAMRWAADSDFATIRGFRYGTHISPGPITMSDLYHYLPIGARVAKVYPVYGNQLKKQIENSARGAFSALPNLWTGGWMFGYSNVTFDLDVYAPYGSRGSNIKIGGASINPNDEGKYVAPHASSVPYSVAGYWYSDDPKTINNCGACASKSSTIDVVKDEQGNPLDVSEIVVRYLKTLPNMTANPQKHRINLVTPLPAAAFGSPEIQPLKGAIAQ
ncbi:MAG: bifunctional metallophosphatase/5'-nucleotidase [Methylobacter sp.]